MKLGLENKRETAVLGVLILIAGYAIYANVLSGPSTPSAPPPAAPTTADENMTIPASAGPAPRVQPNRGRTDEFRPVLRPRRAEDRIDPMKVDPTLHLDLLAKLRNAASENGGRNLFQFGAPPPPPAPPKAAKLNIPEPVVTPRQEPQVMAPPPPPPPPPIPLKYYGISTARANGKKMAFFLEGGENILIAGEGDLLMRRYRVVRIGATSVMVEDTQLKREQAIPLAEGANAPG